MAPPRADRRSLRDGLLASFSRTGLTFALVSIWISLSPSMLPRAWWMTAASVILSAIVGYAIGNLAGWVTRMIAPRIGLRVEMNPTPRRWLRILWWSALSVVTVVVWADSLKFQTEVAALVGGSRPHWSAQVIGVIVGILGTVLLIGLARLVRVFFNWIDRALRRRLPRWLFPGLLATAIVVITVFSTNQFLLRQGLDILLQRAEEANLAVLPGSVQPMEPERSGSPESTEEWDELGAHGQSLVSSGPRAADIEAITGRPATEPIRVYAGLVQGRSLEDGAEAVINELHRTDAFDRSVIVVATTTGSGWVPEWSMQAVEYLTEGDLAIATMQYSYTPSGLAYVLNRTAPAEAGQILFDRVHEEVSALPEEERPLLFVAGESLGSFGSQSAFTDLDDVLERVDGAVWSGTPRFTPLWSELTESRRPGSPEVAPVIDNGRHVRFATRPDELWEDYYGGPFVEWQFPRVVYLQHPSDPVVWWDPSLLWSQPDWLRESVGRDISTQMRWIPWVTFWQVASDMPNSATVPGGYGHNYHYETVPAWAAVLGLDDLTEADFRPIQSAMWVNITSRD